MLKHFYEIVINLLRYIIFFFYNKLILDMIIIDYLILLLELFFLKT